MKLKKGDNVKITAGKDKGKTGKIEKILPKESRVLIPGVNMYKRHKKPIDPRRPAGIIDIVRPLPMASVALICPKCNQQTRVGFLIDNETKKRICRKCGQEI